MDDEPDYTRILLSIEACQDIDRLMTFAGNAQKRNAPIVRDAALAKIETLIPVYKEGSFEFEFWEMFTAYQKTLFANGKPALKLNETWKLAMNDGEVQALNDWVGNKIQAWVFEYLTREGQIDKTAEKLVLKFPKKFTSDLSVLANNRIQMASELLIAPT